MSNEIKTPRSGRKRQSLSPALRSAGKALAHNWGWKLGCLIAAVILWAGLMASDKTLLRPKEFTNVTVTVSESAKESLKSRGFVVVSGLEEDKLSGFTLRASVPLQSYQDTKVSSFTPRVNLGGISAAGTQKVKIELTDKKSEIIPSEIEIEVEEYLTRSRIPVVMRYVGDRPEQFYFPAAVCDPVYITIAGPKSLVSMVSRCVVDFDRSLLPLTAGTKKMAVSSFQLTDQQGNEIARDMIRITPLSSGMAIDSIIVEQEMYPYQQLEISDEDAVKGEPAEGFRVRSVTFSPARVDVAPEDPEADLTGSMIYAASPIDISGLSLTQDFRVDLSRPTGTKIKHMKTEIAWMTVEIEPVPPQDAAQEGTAETEEE